MIEILILYFVYKKLADMAELKGRARSFGWLGVGLWVGGEVIGIIIAVSMRMRSIGSMYGVILPCALVGLVAAFIIVSRLAPAPRVDAAAFD